MNSDIFDRTIRRLHEPGYTWPIRNPFKRLHLLAWQIAYLSVCIARVAWWTLTRNGTAGDNWWQLRYNWGWTWHSPRMESDDLKPLWE